MLLRAWEKGHGFRISDGTHLGDEVGGIALETLYQLAVAAMHTRGTHRQNLDLRAGCIRVRSLRYTRGAQCQNSKCRGGTPSAFHAQGALDVKNSHWVREVAARHYMGTLLLFQSRRGGTSLGPGNPSNLGLGASGRGKVPRGVGLQPVGDLNFVSESVLGNGACRV